ncbi:hypothetical protein CAPTEDRAFT_199286 [Capitella teleta]|uniref:Endonuclease/exonuclease/phosphatase domain-containing protein n=1 Tax=Capitella teleta TaxID=283909 RepID=R7T9N3_CAPTE|nr:hypothetical protein CAPTEDRAFT_199286 [Capitella teleta]|eukprot:ELT87689.1 hypothetical protein CAPTEDRAFT_199286 [Capitella teleta]
MALVIGMHVKGNEASQKQQIYKVFGLWTSIREQRHVYPVGVSHNSAPSLWVVICDLSSGQQKCQGDRTKGHMITPDNTTVTDIITAKYMFSTSHAWKFKVHNVRLAAAASIIHIPCASNLGQDTWKVIFVICVLSQIKAKTESGETRPGFTICLPQPRHASPTSMPSLCLEFIRALAVKAPARLPTDLYKRLNGLRISRRRLSKRGTKGYGRGVIPVQTWLTGTDEDKVVSAALLPDDYAMVHRPHDARGGGVAFIHRRSITLSQIRLGDYSSFEVSDALVCTARRLRMCVVYRPPPSRRNNLTVAQFMSEFADFLSDIVSLPGEPLIVGDFNFHLDDCGDADGSTFSDLLTSFGLKQHVRGPTHEKGHTLDLSRSLSVCAHTYNIATDCTFTDQQRHRSRNTTHRESFVDRDHFVFIKGQGQRKILSREHHMFNTNQPGRKLWKDCNARAKRQNSLKRLAPAAEATQEPAERSGTATLAGRKYFRSH